MGVFNNLNTTKTQKEIPLASEIIRTLKHVIFALIIVNILTIAGFITYLCIPSEQYTVEMGSGSGGDATYIGHDGIVDND